MTGTSSMRPATDHGTVRDTKLRVRAIPILVLLLGEILLGNQLAVVGSPYPLGYLAAHVVLSILLVGFTAHVLLASLRLPRAATKFAAGFTFVATLGATLGGTAFLLGGGSLASLYAMEVLGGFALLGAILLIVWGSVTVTNQLPSAK